MLRRTELRRYLICMLKSTEIPQDEGCSLGPLWENCDGNKLAVYDSDTFQLETNSEGKHALAHDCIKIVFFVDKVDYTLTPTRVENTQIRLTIHIVAVAKNGRKRAEILDTVEERIIYRILDQRDVTSASDGTVLRSFMRRALENTLTIKTTDDSSDEGSYTIRDLDLTFSTKDCINKPDCADEPLCFDFSALTVLDKEQ